MRLVRLESKVNNAHSNLNNNYRHLRYIMQQQSLLSNVCTLMPNGSVFHIAMRSFVAHCPELLTEDVIRRLMTPIECAMTMMSQ